jgi:hypothetical protein
MRRRVWTGSAFLFLAASVAAGCGGGAGDGSTTPGTTPPGTTCPIELPVSGAVSLCIPSNSEVAGTLAFTVAGLPSGVTAEIAPGTATTEPQAVRRRISSATALQQWAVNIADTASGANAVISAPSIALTGVANA